MYSQPAPVVEGVLAVKNTPYVRALTRICQSDAWAGRQLGQGCTSAAGPRINDCKSAEFFFPRRLVRWRRGGDRWWWWEVAQKRLWGRAETSNEWTARTALGREGKERGRRCGESGQWSKQKAVRGWSRKGTSHVTLVPYRPPPPHPRIRERQGPSHHSASMRRAARFGYL